MCKTGRVVARHDGKMLSFDDEILGIKTSKINSAEKSGTPMSNNPQQKAHAQRKETLLMSRIKNPISNKEFESSRQTWHVSRDQPSPNSSKFQFPVDCSPLSSMSVPE